MITIRVDNAGAMNALTGINPAQIQSKVRVAIRKTLEAGKAEGRVRIIARYTAASPLSLGKVKQRARGLTGALTFGGKRNQLKKFTITPRSRMNPPPAGGVRVMVVKGQGGMLRHAFLQRSGAVMERVSRARFPIRQIKTLGLGGMARAVARHVVSKMDNQIERELAVL